MHVSAKAIAIGMVALFVAPAAAATWRSYGSFEPDNALDDPLFMYFDAPAPSVTNRVYFNSYPTYFLNGANGGTLNPNVGAFNSRMEIPGTEIHEAVLGVWVDCNGDGYIGMAETAVREYANELLLDKSRCPPVTGKPNTWEAGAHNYNGWVTELIPIGNKEATPADGRVYKDDEAMIWGDYGRPFDPAVVQICTTGFPRGTTQTTGGFVNWLDCRTPAIETWNTAVTTVDPSNSQGLAYADADNAVQPGHPLQHETFGSEDSSKSAFYAWDCSSPSMINTTRDVHDDIPNVEVYNPNPRLGSGSPTGWTVPGTWNATREGYEAGSGPAGNCDHSDDSGRDFYGGILGESNTLPKYVENKIKSDWNFAFRTASRGGAPPISLVRPGKAGAATDFGIEALGHGCFASSCMQSSWRATTSTAKAVETVEIDRTNVDVQPAAARYLTFYAHVGTATTGRGLALPGGSGVYGSDQCGTSTSGIKMGWNCDSTAWYVNADGSAASETTRPLARVGQPYELRDVDCYDGTLYDDGTTSVGVGLPYYGESPCA